jgi:hypothetical protein
MIQCVVTLVAGLHVERKSLIRHFRRTNDETEKDRIIEQIKHLNKLSDEFTKVMKAY